MYNILYVTKVDISKHLTKDDVAKHIRESKKYCMGLHKYKYCKHFANHFMKIRAYKKFHECHYFNDRILGEENIAKHKKI